MKVTQSCPTLCDHGITQFMELKALKPIANEVKVAQLGATVCDPMDYTFPGILQARILEWIAFLFSRGSSQPRDQTQVSHITG